MKIAILTNFGNFMRGYSLVGIAKDQATMLRRYGHEVHLYVLETYDDTEPIPDGVILERKIPKGHLFDFLSLQQFNLDYAKQLKQGFSFTTKDGEKVTIDPDPTGARNIADSIRVRKVTAQVLRDELKDKDIAITHDWIFQGWNLPYGLACKDVTNDLPNTKWLHWIHSVPNMGPMGKDFWDITSYGPRHKIVYPNSSDAIKCAEQFKGWCKDVLTIPHPKDLSSFGNFSDALTQFLDWCPGLQTADIKQVYMAAVDRFEAKGILELIHIFAGFKRLGQTVCLVIANQWCTVDKHREKVDAYKKLAMSVGLTINKDIYFTSDFDKCRHEVGIDNSLIFELLHYTNVYISLTSEETFGLGIAEAALIGNLLVLNKNLDVMKEITAFKALYFAAPSHAINFKVDNLPAYLFEVSKVILHVLSNDSSLQTKTQFIKENNLDNLYRRYYAPVLAASRGWA